MNSLFFDLIFRKPAQIAYARLMAVTGDDRIRSRDPRINWLDDQTMNDHFDQAAALMFDTPVEKVTIEQRTTAKVFFYQMMTSPLYEEAAKRVKAMSGSGLLALTRRFQRIWNERHPAVPAEDRT